MHEQEINLLSLLANFIRKGKKILLVALVFGILLGIYQYRSQKNLAKESARISLGLSDISELEKIDNWKTKVDDINHDIYQVELENFKETKENLISQQKNTQEKLVHQRSYIDDSLLMQIDGYNEYVSQLSLSVVNTDTSALQQPFGANVTPIDYITSKINSQYQLLWANADLADALDLKLYSNVSDKYLRELITLSVTDGNMLSIRAIGNSPEMAEELTDAAHRFLLDKSEAVSKDSFSHYIVLIDHSSKNIIDSSVIATQEASYALLESYKNTITTIDEQLATLRPPSEPTRSGILAIVLYLVLGCFVGAFFMFCVISGHSLFSTLIDNSREMAAFLQIAFLGRLPYRRSHFDIWADRLLNEQVWDDQATALAYISEKAAIQCSGRQKILLLSSLPIDMSCCKEITNALKNTLQDVRFEGDYLHNPSAISALEDCDGIILIEQLHKSKASNLSAIKQFTQQIGKPIDGFILL